MTTMEMTERENIIKGINHVSSVSSDRYVVLHKGLGSWRRGDVLSSSDLGGPDAVLRLLGLKAVRAARGGEALEKRVEILEDSQPNQTYEQQIAERDLKISAMQDELSALRDEQMRSQPHLKNALTLDREQSEALLREKDRMLVDAQTRYGALQVRTTDLERICAELRQENVVLTQKLRNMEAAVANPGHPDSDTVRRRLADISGHPAPGTEQETANPPVDRKRK